MSALEVIARTTVNVPPLIERDAAGVEAIHVVLREAVRDAPILLAQVSRARLGRTVVRVSVEVQEWSPSMTVVVTTVEAEAG